MNLSNKILALFFVSIFFVSCAKEEDNIPGADDRDVFVGSWVTSETSKQFGSTAFTITISKSTSDNENLIIKNFYNLGSSANTIASVSGGNVTIAQQQVSAQGIKGSGSLSNGKINWSYTSDDGIQRDTCTAISSK